MYFDSSSDEDYVVFTMYKNDNHSCSKNKMGTYKTDVGSFLKAYVRQKEQLKENYGIEYQGPDDKVMMYADCQAIYNNNVLVGH